MATTSIWSVKGWLGKVVIYVENPEKTIEPQIVKLSDAGKRDMQGLSDVIAYAVNEEKTRNSNKKGEEGMGDNENENPMQQYVSGINCCPLTARTEMLAVKKRYGKEEGIMAFHGYQSFAPGECTPAKAHEIGIKLAEELWGSRFQVLVATHLDKAHHLHNHFVVNSVSFADGLRYHRSNQDYRDMRTVSDRLCREYGLSVIENKEQKKAKHYAEWKAEKEGKPTYHGMVKADIDEAIRKSRTEKQFFHYLKEKGYSFKFGKDITVRAEGRERGLKLARNFGKDYTMEAIRSRILSEQEMNTPLPLQKKKVYAIRVRGNFQQAKKIGGLRGLYLHYCYLLGILPKNRASVTPKQLHILLREDLMQLDKISKETRLLCHYQIDTIEQLFSLKKELQEKIAGLADIRIHLRYRIRSIKDDEKIAEVKTEISKLTKQIRKLRKEVVLCDDITVRSVTAKEKIKVMQQKSNKGKEDKQYEHIRRGR